MFVLDFHRELKYAAATLPSLNSRPAAPHTPDSKLQSRRARKIRLRHCASFLGWSLLLRRSTGGLWKIRFRSGFIAEDVSAALQPHFDLHLYHQSFPRGSQLMPEFSKMGHAHLISLAIRNSNLVLLEVVDRAGRPSLPVNGDQIPFHQSTSRERNGPISRA
jgi:hypothetical protein